ncbi:MAG: hypothetical protein ACK4E3_10580 [Brevundimonas sp.]|uniref:hypothetical protein n=1 Tax=Brevundimonas sp. TaxID=1871086 RepID=UPI00391AD510
MTDHTDYPEIYADGPLAGLARRQRVHESADIIQLARVANRAVPSRAERAAYMRGLEKGRELAMQAMRTGYAPMPQRDEPPARGLATAVLALATLAIAAAILWGAA